MRIVCISDSHLIHDEMAVPIPDGDLLIHAGDFTFNGTLDQVRRGLDWFSKYPHPRKIAIAGNHDWFFQKAPGFVSVLLRDHPEITYLQDSEVMIDNIRIWGSPWTPEFMNWAFNVKRGELWRKWEKIPETVDIVVTHGPPSGDLGGVLPVRGEELGDLELFSRIMKIRPKLHVSGHIHTGHGLRERGGVLFANASLLDETYRFVHEPIVVDL